MICTSGMGKQIFIGLATEGTTDTRFLESIVKRTFDDIAFRECQQDIDVYVHPLHVPKIGLSFPDYVAKVSHEGVSQVGIMTLAIHTDADKDSYEVRRQNKVIPAQKRLDALSDDYCKLLTPVIPIRMIEAWMLADTSLLKEEIGSSLSDHELGLDRPPETIADPKQTIENAIRIANTHLPKRRHHLHISDLYDLIGDKISLPALSRLSSYRLFQDAVRSTYKRLHYLV